MNLYDRLDNASGIYCFLVLFYFFVKTLISDFYIIMFFRAAFEHKLMTWLNVSTTMYL